MSKPVKPVAPPPALRSQPSTFSARFEGWILYSGDTLPNYTDLLADFVDARATQAEAAVLVGDVTPAPAKALELLRFNSGGTALESASIASLKATLANAQAGAGDGLMDATLTKAAIDAQVPALVPLQIGVGQTWQSVTRAVSTSYQNTTGRPIMIAIRGANGNTVQVSVDNVTWVSVGALISASGVPMTNISAIVPNTHYYRVNGGSVSDWTELR